MDRLGQINIPRSGSTAEFLRLYCWTCYPEATTEDCCWHEEGVWVFAFDDWPPVCVFTGCPALLCCGWEACRSLVIPTIGFLWHHLLRQHTLQMVLRCTLRAGSRSKVFFFFYNLMIYLMGLAFSQLTHRWQGTVQAVQIRYIVDTEKCLTATWVFS